MDQLMPASWIGPITDSIHQLYDVATPLFSPTVVLGKSDPRLRSPPSPTHTFPWPAHTRLTI